MTYWLNNIQLPAWLSNRAQNTRVSIAIENGLVKDIVSTDTVTFSQQDSVWEGNGKLAISGLSEIHTHLDKTYARHRMGDIAPGLLNAIEATQQDKLMWDEEDLLARMSQGLKHAYENGVTHIRTHIDWFDLTCPVAWGLVDELSEKWKNKINIERVALIPMPLFEDLDSCMSLARHVARSDLTLLGAFIHSSNYSEVAMENLFAAAKEFNLDLDLHINEELQSAEGLLWLADYLNNQGFPCSITCGHACGLHVLSESEQRRVLGVLAKHDVTLVALPTTNLLLQDAETDITPIHRGVTIVKEALSCGVDVMFSSDNVADAFCPYGDYNPVSVLKLACLTAQLDSPFEKWSQTICSLKPNKRSLHSVLIGQPADFIIFDHNNVHIWPEYQQIQVMRNGQWSSEKPI